ncbi:molecular chaperone [Paracoccus seriniphilus]|uniref:Fimbrial chaperone protein n=1 Tax=Paracoccus seriniphilus TaxID=184748 RepID=A0A239Q0K9_9RHOB|nr:molecular chaperone [Paracoccus seriniphilus]WCR15810.1 molecular chaperone [Paracoccus seriniphilus]SNT76139.1 fimbrial chaperone protein [Paracoccus seriniphilus]
MMNLLCRGLLALMLCLSFSTFAGADGLRVSPVMLDVPAPGATTTLTLRNEGRQPITVQARSFRWEQGKGQERLRRTKDVVVSPPATRLAPGASQTIRVVRTSKRPVRSEEAYRVFINEVPDQGRSRSGAVAFATELRIPVFFTPAGARNPDVVWSLRNSRGATFLVGQNRGDTRLRLADLRMTGASGARVARRGLVGYVLGGATMQWPVAAAGRLGAGARLKAATNLGTLDAQVPAR